MSHQRQPLFFPAKWLTQRALCVPSCITVVQSLEDEAVRAQVLRLVSLPLWHALSRGRLQLELHDQPQVSSSAAGGQQQDGAGSCPQSVAGSGHSAPSWACRRAVLPGRREELVHVPSVYPFLPSRDLHGSPLHCFNTFPQLAKHWRHLAKKEAKAAQQEGHVPVHQRPEATFLPGKPWPQAGQSSLTVNSSNLTFVVPSSCPPPACFNCATCAAAGLLTEYLEVLSAVVPEEQAMEEDGQEAAVGGSGKLDRQALLYCERFVEFLTDLLSQVGQPGGWSWEDKDRDGCDCLLMVVLLAGCCRRLPDVLLVCLPLPPLTSTLLAWCSFPLAGLCMPCWRTVPFLSSATCRAFTHIQRAASMCRCGGSGALLLWCCSGG